ncbi:hypothetical protein [Streptomyces sp. NPDC093269]|uniref:hypothetical protein n=1 Tax=Streptomyces sp. NPDC093269 TaxID=3366038 RepID=UPI00380B1FCD
MQGWFTRSRRPTVHPHTASTDHVDDAWAKERMRRAGEDAPRGIPHAPDAFLRHPETPRVPFCGGRTPLAGTPARSGVRRRTAGHGQGAALSAIGVAPRRALPGRHASPPAPRLTRESS